jgi:hypothetical protein
MTRYFRAAFISLLLAVMILAVCLTVPCTWAATGIDPAQKYAWSENAGWVNFAPNNGGVTVLFNGTNGYLRGYAWNENIGWLKLGASVGGPYANDSATNWGVNFDPAGKLSGYAWSENAGWINFGHVLCDAAVSLANGEFSGHAWGENVGWLKFRGSGPAYGVRTPAFEPTPNHAPVANPNALSTPKDQAAQITAAKLLANDIDVDGDTLTLTGVSATSAAGGTVTLGAGVVTYTPAAGYAGSDSFTYAISDARGGIASGTVTATVRTGGGVTPNIVYAVVEGSDFVVRFAGIPGYTYTIEFTDTLSPANWQKKVNATAPTIAGSFGVGVFEFRENTSGATSRYYRTVWPAYIGP